MDQQLISHGRVAQLSTHARKGGLNIFRCSSIKEFQRSDQIRSDTQLAVVSQGMTPAQCMHPAVRCRTSSIAVRVIALRFVIFGIDVK